MRIFVAALLTILSWTVLADEVTFISEQTSSLRLVSYNQGLTTFGGTLRIRGHFLAESNRTPSEETTYRVVFYPDKASKRILPYDKDRGRVNEIWLRNTDQALALLGTTENVRLLQSGKINAFSGTAKISISSYQSSVDCDERNYSAEIVNKRGNVTQLATGASFPEDFGC